mmetsp:Transcript_17637/g.45312  ORF Transcript_17637/g.45312 Transcript_17637/m.45312 type:complete len:547 (+) Transcript_17637:33-1673(+)
MMLSRSAMLGRGLMIYAKLAMVQVIGTLAWKLWTCFRMRRMLKDVPRSRYTPHWLLGSVKAQRDFAKSRHHWRNEATIGLPVSKTTGILWDPAFISLTIRDPELIKHYLQDKFDVYSKAEPSNGIIEYTFGEWLGRGIFSAPHGVGAADAGDNWLRQRKIASQIFTRANMTATMTDTFVDRVHRMISVIKPGEKVDMQVHFFNYTMDSIMHLFFGVDADSLRGQSNAYGTAFDTAHRSFMKYVMEALFPANLCQLLPFPFGGLNGLAMRWQRYRSQSYKEFRDAIALLDSESARIVAECNNDPNLPDRQDLLARFLRAVKAEGCVPDAQLTTYLRDTVLNFVIAGRDTTACTLAWMFYILGTHPEIQQRVQEEIDEKLPNLKEPDWKAVASTNMPVLHALLYETLRLYPPVPLDNKVAHADDVLPDGTKVPKNTKLFFFPWGMARDPAVYPEPEKVKLERWIPFSNPPAHEFPVFQAGPRICLGKDMAIMESKIVAAMLLQRFSFTLAKGEAEKIHYSAMLTMSVCNSKNQDSHNLWLIPEERKQK